MDCLRSVLKIQISLVICRLVQVISLQRIAERKGRRQLPVIAMIIFVSIRI